MALRRAWLVLAALAVLAGGSHEPRAEEGGAGARVPRRATLGAFLDAHWQLPIPPQGPAPAGFSALEASLDPTACAVCHPQQHAQWRDSLHAGAYSPGFAGQLVEGDLASPSQVRSCQRCHAPLAEQQPHTDDLAPNAYDAALRMQGIVCAACHVRGHRRFGPPRREPAPPGGGAAHGGFEPRPEFAQSRFCATCHQFFDDEGVNGKPIENTYAEWRASPQAAQGRSCQSCHMPERAHLWRGIHDPETVRAAVDVDLVGSDLTGERLRAALVLRSRDVGHFFPTYVTPRVFLAVWQADASGRELEGTRLEATIGREIDFAQQPWREVFDTRVAPGEAVQLDYDLARRPAASELVGRVRIDPAHHYRGVFGDLLGRLRSPDARAWIEEALRRASASAYVLAEVRTELPARPKAASAAR